MHDMSAIANRMLDSIKGYDLEGLRAVYAPDAQLWHSSDDVVQTVDESLAVVQFFMSMAQNIRFTNQRQIIAENSFVCTHRMTATINGKPLDMGVCIVCDVNEEGRISRLEEYFDSAMILRLMSEA